MNKRKGAALVEFAIILPLLLTLVFGIIEFGWMLRTYQAVASVGREACRTGALGGDVDKIAARVTSAAALYDLKTTPSGTLTDTPEWRHLVYSGGTWTVERTSSTLPNTTTAEWQVDDTHYNEVKVEVRYQYSLITGGLFSWITGSNIVPMRTSVIMRKES